MAYNPFDFFRRNQKLFFAGLTVLVMFMFVLSFGQGDFFSWFPQQLAKWQTTGDVMVTVDGGKIKESQLGDIGRERTLANGYMLQAAGKALRAAAVAADAEVSAANPDLRSMLTREMSRLNGVLNERLTAEDAAMLRVAVAREIGRPLADLERSTPKAEDARRVKAVRVYAEMVMGELARRGSSERSDGGVYFANQPNRTDRDRLDFLLWKKKADQLGIRYTHEDVQKLVDAEFPTVSLTQDELKALAMKVAADGQRKNTGELYDALADEFRVRAAQTAVIGVGDVRDLAAVPVGTTQERYEHFVNETTATKYAFLTIPVDAYLPMVKGEPTDAELTKIFNDLSSTDPDPASPRPGIREPRKVGVQWVEVSGREDYYKALAARRVLAVPQAQAVFGPALTSVAPAFATYDYDEYLKEQSAVAAARQQAFLNPGRPALTFTAEVKADAMRALGGTAVGHAFRESLVAQGGENTFMPGRSSNDGLLDAELATPQLAAALAGLTASGAATFAPVRAADVAVFEAAYRQSRADRVVAGMRAFQFPTAGLAGLAEAIGGATAVDAASPAPMSRASVQPLLDKRTADQLRGEVASEDVKAFADELGKIMKAVTDKSPAADKTEAKKKAAEYVAKWVADRGLKSGTSTEPRSVHQLADDPGLAPLLAKDHLLTDFGNKPKNSLSATLFGQAFVNEAEFQLARTPQGFAMRMKPATGLYQPRDYSPKQMRGGERQEYAPFGTALRVSGDPDNPLTMVWRIAEVDAVRPLSLASDPAAKERCKAVWKMNKARELARKAADEAAKLLQEAGAKGEIQVGQAAEEALQQLRKPFADNKAAADRFLKYDPAPSFTVAKLLVSDGGLGGPPMVTPFNPQHPAVVYETEKIREELVANKDKPLGTTFVLADQPQTTLFLTVVAGRDQKGESMFKQYVLHPTNPLPPMQGFAPLSPEMLDPRFATAAREADRKQAVALLKAEFKVKDENPKLDEKGS